jgi:hypothetical protein
MQEISWKEWYESHKGKKPLNEITCDYNLYCLQYESYQQCLWLLGNGDTFFILQENDEFLLQENGDRLIWQIKE